MIDIVYSPVWFYGKDIIIDVISIFVLALISLFSIKYYRIDKSNKNYLYLGIAFSLMALSFIFKIMTNFTIYYNVLESIRIGQMVYTYNELEPSNILFFIGFLMQRILMLVGLYSLYVIYLKEQNKSKSHIFLVIYLILVATYFSRAAYYMFYLTSFMLLALITWRYIDNCRKSRNLSVKLLACSFGILAVSQLPFIFISFSRVLYVIAESIQLVGFIILLATFIMVLRHGKKKG